MYKKIFKKLLYLLMITMMLSIIPGCDEDSGKTPTTEATWQTIFEDDFNRDNTVSGLGSNWSIEQDSGIKISNQEAYTGDTDSSEFFYINNVTETQVKISAKIRTTALGGSPTFQFFAKRGADSTYLIGYDDDGLYLLKFSGTWSLIDYTLYSITEDTIYLCESIIENSSLTFNLKDSSGNILQTLSGNDASPLTGSQYGLNAGGDSTTAVIYLDDYKIEVYK